MKGARQRMPKLFAADGAPSPTFLAVTVRGRVVPVATTQPYYVERPVGTLNWLLAELEKEAHCATPVTRTPVQEYTPVDLAAIAVCSGHASVKWAPSKHAFWAARVVKVPSGSSTSSRCVLGCAAGQ